MDFKKTYTKEDSDELLKWIDTNPKGSVDLGHGIKIKYIENYLKQAIGTIKTQYENPNYCGFFYDLYRVKEEYEKMNKGTSTLKTKS